MGTWGGWGTTLTMRSASALRFSKGCSSLNLDRILTFVEKGTLCLLVLFLRPR